MTTKELTQQAFKLYDTLKAQSERATGCSNIRNRLHFLGLRAFYRYKRRLKAE